MLRIVSDGFTTPIVLSGGNIFATGAIDVLCLDYPALFIVKTYRVDILAGSTEHFYFTAGGHTSRLVTGVNRLSIYRACIVSNNIVTAVTCFCTV